MQNIDQLTRNLAAALQLTPAYARFVAAKEHNDADASLAELMRKIELVRMQYQHEAAKGEAADDEVMGGYDVKFHEMYDAIMANENMQEYQIAADAMDKLLQRVIGILTGCAQGEDPATYEPEQEHSGCGGSCGGCNGCG